MSQALMDNLAVEALEVAMVILLTLSNSDLAMEQKVT